MGAKLSCRMSDDFGRSTHRSYGMETQTLLADYVTAYQAFFVTLAAVTDLSLEKADLVIQIAGEEWAVTADASVDTGATASGLIDGGLGKRASMKIPGIKLSLVGADGAVAITGVVATFLGEFEVGDDFNLSDGEQIEVGGWTRAALDR